MASWEDFKVNRSANSLPIVGPAFDASTGTLASPAFLTGRCTDHHPALILPCIDASPPRMIYGGSCSHPAQTDCDVYIGLDWGFEPSSPWGAPGGPIRAHYQIADMQAPKSPASFKRMIGWLHEQVHDGKKCHVGCIGGHGRTGMVLAALVAMQGEKDAITYVRQHYCAKAVETAEQVEFLAKHFGITPVDGAKEAKRKGVTMGGTWDWDHEPDVHKRLKHDMDIHSLPKLREKKRKVQPLTGSSIFGDPLR